MVGGGGGFSLKKALTFAPVLPAKRVNSSEYYNSLRMLYLILSILCSTLISVVFRLYKDYNVDTFQAIIYNYWVCFAIGTAALGRFPVDGQVLSSGWFPYALVLGMVFIGSFVLIARTVQHFGISITAVTQRMSLLMTVAFAIGYFGESLTLLKGLGIVLAIGAVALTSLNPKDLRHPVEEAVPRWMLFLPLLVFVLSGGIECVLQYVQRVELSDNVGQLAFTTILFGTAGSVGLLVWGIQVARGQMRLGFRHLLGGIALGIPNFGSIYFLLRLLDQGWDGSLVFPLNNVGIILFSTLVALLLFRERLTPLKQWGIALAIAAMGVMIGLGI